MLFAASTCTEHSCACFASEWQRPLETSAMAQLFAYLLVPFLKIRDSFVGLPLLILLNRGLMLNRGMMIVMMIQCIVIVNVSTSSK